MGELVFNFGPVAGGFKCDVESQFFHAYFWAPQQWENTSGTKKFKGRLFFCTSILQLNGHNQSFEQHVNHTHHTF